MRKTILFVITLLLMFNLSACALLEKNPITTNPSDNSINDLSGAGRDENYIKDRRKDSSEKSNITDVYSTIKDFVPKDFLNNAISGNFNFNDLTSNINIQGRNETKTIDATDVNSIIITPDIGNIEIFSSNDNNIYLEVSYGLIGSKDKTFSEEDLDSISIQTENRNGVIHISHSYNGPGTSSLIAANYKISIPNHLNVIDIDANIANISIKDVSVQLAVSVGTGNIETHNIGLKHDSFVDVNTGAIQLNISKFDGLKSLSSKCSTGEIRVNISETNLGALEYIDIENGIGSINFKMATPFDNITLKNTFGEITSNVDYK